MGALVLTPSVGEEDLSRIMAFKMYTTISFLIFLFCLVKCNSQELVKVGDFINHFHDITGQVFIKDDKTLVIKGFGYDGTGPDSFFFAGTSDKISSNVVLLPYPFENQFYDYEDKNVPILERS